MVFFFRIFEINIFCFVVALFDPVNDVEAMHDLCKLLLAVKEGETCSRSNKVTMKQAICYFKNSKEKTTLKPSYVVPRDDEGQKKKNFNFQIRLRLTEEHITQKNN